MPEKPPVVEKVIVKNVGFSQLTDMISAQVNAHYSLQNQHSSGVIIQTFMSYTASILGLVFAASTPAGVAFGITSLMTSLSSSETQALADKAKEGKNALYELYTYMSINGWTSANISTTVFTNSDQFGIIRTLKVNSVTGPKGTVYF